MSLNPIPTIHHYSIPKSQATVPKSIRKPPTKRVVQSDQIPLFRDQFRCADIEDVVKYINTAREYQNFTHCITESGVTAYRVEINSGIAQVKECIHITSDLHVKLSFQSCPIPLPDYIAKSVNSKITSLDMLTNLPNYCRNFTHTFDSEPIKELLHLCNYHPKSCKYSSHVIRFALQLRYTSHAAYRLLHHHIPLPSERLLRNLKSESIDSISALCKLRDEGFCGNDVVLLLDEMHLQQQVQFDGRDLIGCNENLEMFKSILCFMVVSLKKSIPYIIKAIPIVKLSKHIICDGILNCIKILNDADFQLRCVISDNHQSNVSSFNTLMKDFPINGKNYCMKNPMTEKIIYLFYDTVHLVKNIRNNLLGRRFFTVPKFELSLLDVLFSVPEGHVRWCSLHKVHDFDLSLNCHVTFATLLH